jgi:hypothetical protein
MDFAFVLLQGLAVGTLVSSIGFGLLWFLDHVVMLQNKTKNVY